MDDMIPILRGGGDGQSKAIDPLPIGLLSSGMMAQQRHSLLQNSGKLKLLSHGSRGGLVCKGHRSRAKATIDHLLLSLSLCRDTVHR